MSITSILSPNRHTALVADLHKAEQRVQRELAQQQADLERADTRATHLRASLDEAYATCARIEAAIRETRSEFDRARAALEAEIVAAADPRIDEFLTWLDREKTALPRQLVQREGIATDARGERYKTESSNADAVGIVARALNAARDRARALKLEAVPDVGKALEEIRRSIPTVQDAEERIAG